MSGMQGRERKQRQALKAYLVTLCIKSLSGHIVAIAV